MTPDQVEVLSKLVTLTSAAAAVALALAQTAKTLLEIADKLVKRRRRARQRARPSGTGRRPRRHGKDAAARRSAPPRRGCRRGPRPGPGRGRAPPGRRRARRRGGSHGKMCGSVGRGKTYLLEEAFHLDAKTIIRSEKSRGNGTFHYSNSCATRELRSSTTPIVRQACPLEA